MRIVYFIIIAVLLASCAVPAPIIKLTPSTIQNKDYWNLGQQFVFAENRNVWFDCAFNRIENGKIIYDVKITNESDSAVLVDPVFFMQQVFKNDSLLIGSNFAENPEMTLLNLELQENVDQAHTKNVTAAAITSAVILLGVGIAVAASSSSDEPAQETYVETSSVEEEPVEFFENTNETNVRTWNNWTNRTYLAERFLRKTTLPKGYFVDGEVHFPYDQNALWYRLIFKAGKAETDFFFKQYMIYPVSTY